MEHEPSDSFPEPMIAGLEAIAAVLGCSVRQVHRLRARGLPLYQLGPLCTVRAVPSEVRAWAETHGLPQPGEWRRRAGRRPRPA